MFEKIYERLKRLNINGQLLKKIADILLITLFILNIAVFPSNYITYQKIGFNITEGMGWSFKYLSVLFGVLYIISLINNKKIMKEKRSIIIKNLTVGVIFISLSFGILGSAGLVPFINAKFGKIIKNNINVKVSNKEEYIRSRNGNGYIVEVMYGGKNIELSVDNSMYMKVKLGDEINLDEYTGSIGIKFYKNIKIINK